MADDLEERVKAAYRRHFEDTRKWADAWNKTLEEVSGSYDPEASEERHQLREQVGQILRKVRSDIEADLGDPYALAMRVAMEDLKRDRVLEAIHRAYREELQGIKNELLKKHGSNGPRGPKEWRPKGGRLKDPSEAVEKEMEKAFEKDPFDLSLKIGFDSKGGLIGWRIGYPSESVGYYSAVLTISDQTDYNDIERAIEEAFESIDWKKIEEELENEDA